MDKYFEGVRFIHDSDWLTKERGQKYAKSLREKGFLARVVYLGPNQWGVWKRHIVKYGIGYPERTKYGMPKKTKTKSKKK